MALPVLPLVYFPLAVDYFLFYLFLFIYFFTFCHIFLFACESNL